MSESTQERQDLMRQLGLVPPPADRHPTTIEHAAGVIVIGDNNTINVAEREERPRSRRPAKPR